MQNSLNLLDKCSESGKIAMFYGFYPVSGPQVKKCDTDITKDMNKEWHPEAKAALLREFYDTKNSLSRLPQPLMLWIDGNGKESKPNHKLECTLSILNSGKSITEAMIIQAAKAILENAGFKNLSVRINSVGNKESVSEFERKMGGFIRKRFNEFPQDLRLHLKKDPLFLAKTKDEKYKTWKDAAPQNIDCLSEESRVHFKEVLEFLEILEIPYSIDSTIIGDLAYSTEIIFEIVTPEDEIVGRGMCYSRLSKRLQLKKELPAVDVFIRAKALRIQKSSSIKELHPKFYLVQFGPEAKLKSLLVLESLRKAGVPVLHSLAKDKLTGQILTAEQLGIPYIILLGQKEALENSVTIRNTTTRSQTSIPITLLGEHIKQYLK
jgi:histidyl-tRNA synthetase